MSNTGPVQRPAIRWPSLRMMSVDTLSVGSVSSAALLASLGMVTPALASGAEGARTVFADAFNVVGLSTVAGLAVFAATTAILHVRERSRWNQRDAALSAELDAVMVRAEQAELFGSTDDQVIVTWAGPSAKAEIRGVADFLQQGPVRVSPLAFGSWVETRQVKTISDLVDTLKARGEPFDLGLQTRSGHFVEARGRAVSGRAVFHLRDVSGTRRQLEEARQQRQTLEQLNQQLSALVNASPNPAWLRAPSGELAWVNAAYVKAVEGPSAEATIRDGLELMDREEREKAALARKSGDSFATRAFTVVGGQRLMLDVSEKPNGHGFAGQAIDISELEAIRGDLARQMQAHVKVLDRLPTAVAAFDQRQRLAYRNVAYEKLWSLDPAYLDTQPTDGEILDRLRTAHRLPEAGGYKDWKNERLKAYTKPK